MSKCRCSLFHEGDGVRFNDSEKGRWRVKQANLPFGCDLLLKDLNGNEVYTTSESVEKDDTPIEKKIRYEQLALF
jgi:hypothetical protein